MLGTGLALPEVARAASLLRGTMPLRFAAFPRLAAAYAAGRGLVSVIGDSTTFGLGAGSGGFYGVSNGANALSAPRALIAGLAAAGITAIDGCANFGNRNAFSSAGTDLPGYYGGGVLPGGNTIYSGSWPHISGWGRIAATNVSPGLAASFAPGFAWDRAEAFLVCPTGISGAAATLDVGGPTLVSTGDFYYSAGQCLKQAVSAPRGANTLAIRIASGYLGIGGVRCWDSTTPHVQIENLGNPDWRTSDWVDATLPYSALSLVPRLGSHLFIINLGLNDRHYGRTAAAFKADLKTLAQTCRTAGADVLLAIPHGAINGSDYDLGPDFATAIGQVAGELGLAAPIDLRTAGLVAADYYDNVHLLGRGYARIGAAYAARLLG